MKLSAHTKALVDFLKEIEQLQRVKRIIDREDGSQENTAEHSWHVAMFVLMLGNEVDPKADMARMLKLALIHDLVEIYAGDTYMFDEKARENKEERELEAAKRLFSQLPKDKATEYWQLFEEFESLKTVEAKIVKSFDYIQPLMQNIIHNGATWQKRRLTAKMNDDKKRPTMIHNRKVLEIYEALHQEALGRKLFIDED
ncbi:MAG: HD domain-containing protein [Candidatus Berkelbacteria bacterium]|nr:HD domain-containing protein [Candidatus Berkelbacteria bacterium]